MEENLRNDQIQTVGNLPGIQRPTGSDQCIGASECSQRTGTTVSVPNSWVNGVVCVFQSAWEVVSALGVVSAVSTESEDEAQKISEDEAQKIKEVNNLLDDFSPDLQYSFVAGFFSESSLSLLAEKQPVAEQPVAEPDLLDGSFVVVDLDPDERRDLRAKIGLSDPVQREKDKVEAQSIMLQQSFVPHRGTNFGVAPRPLSEKVPPSNVVDPNSIGKPYERIPGPERTTGDTKSQVRRVRVAEQGSLQGGIVTTVLTVNTCSP
jgi:hypothetical protein